MYSKESRVNGSGHPPRNARQTAISGDPDFPLVNSEADICVDRSVPDAQVEIERRLHNAAFMAVQGQKTDHPLPQISANHFRDFGDGSLPGNTFAEFAQLAVQSLFLLM